MGFFPALLTALLATAPGAIPAGADGSAARAAADTVAVQQGVEYRIEATLDDASGVLRGRARLRYVNRSPFTLDTLWFHQHLNAFRPNSAWARRDLAELSIPTFQLLGPQEHAYERLQLAEVDGVAVRPVYPGAPDSTVMGLPLRRPLRPGESVTVLLDWEARLATVARRQGRRGRHHDFAHWYPRIAVVDEGGWQVNPLVRSGEFYGEFASWDVTLEVAEDQVIGATGVPVEGDPGWTRAAVTGRGPVSLQRMAYGAPAPDPLGLLAGEPAPGRKRVRWRAEQVHHFAWSTSPDYRYEGGEWEGVAIHVLYQPGDTAWDDGVVVERSRTVLAWYSELFGERYPYPQFTNLHRIESGGTEFPMLVMNGSPSLGLIAHEAAHQWAHAILANNEWREAWLDEGMASFLNQWFMEAHGRPADWGKSLDQLAQGPERDPRRLPVATPAHEFPDYNAYGRATYAKGSAVLYMLRELLGADVFREGLRRYYAANRFRHVSERELREAMESASGRDLGWFFHQWLHTTAQLDYRLGTVETRPRDGGGWTTTVEVLWTGEAWMPVTLAVDGEQRVLNARERRQLVRVDTAERPRVVELDPARVILDLDRSNNRWTP